MLCTNCNANNATFHYKQIKGGSVKEIHLCNECAHALGYMSKSESIFDIGGLLNDFITPPKSDNIKAAAMCPRCGTTYGEFRRTGLLGCDGCYDAFGDVIESSLSKIQPSTTHKGSLGGANGKKIEKENELNAYKKELQKAILEERYEDAAVLRDKIKKMEVEENG